MHSSKNLAKTLLGLLLVVGLIAGCVGGAKIEVPNLPDPGDEEPEIPEHAYLLRDDFADAELGQVPAGWRTGNEEFANIQVVEDGDLPSGKAVRYTTISPAEEEGNKTTSLRMYLWDPPAADYETIAVQFRFKHVAGSGINAYVLHSGNRLHWAFNDSKAITFNDGGTTRTIGELEPGWNLVRIIANREKDEAYVFLNDMDTPLVEEPMQFREQIASWVGAELSFSHTSYTNSTSEALYGDVKIWGIE